MNPLTPTKAELEAALVTLTARVALLEEALRGVLDFPTFGPACQEHDPNIDPEPLCEGCEAQLQYGRDWDAVTDRAREALATAETKETT